jgi:hypothetical protein
VEKSKTNQLARRIAGLRLLDAEMGYVKRGSLTDGRITRIVRRKLRSRRIDPIERHDLPQLGFPGFSPPAANTGDFFCPRHCGGFTLQANPTLTFRAFQDELVSFIHVAILDATVHLEAGQNAFGALTCY